MTPKDRLMTPNPEMKSKPKGQKKDR